MPRCKHCKVKFVSKRFNAKFCLETIECIKEWNEFRKSEEKRIQERKWAQTKKSMRESLETVAELRKKTQIIFNRWIRERDKNQPCISCQNPNPKKVNAGHYFSAYNHSNVTFNEDNVHLQCEYCNTSLSGNLIEYRKNLILKIGVERFESLEKIAYTEKRYTKDELNEINTTYKNKLKNI